MTAVTKFMFDVQFDSGFEPGSGAVAGASMPDVEGDDAGADSAAEGDINVDEQEEELPGYSEAQLEEAKAESFEAGKQEGAREAASTIEKETLMTLQAISLNITDIFSHQEQANNGLLRDGISIASSIVRKLFPAMNEQNALSEIERLVEHTLLRLIEEPRVVIRVNPDLIPSLSERVEGLKAGAGYEGRIVLKEDDSIVFGDCRMEWGDGSAARNVSSLWQSIDQIIAGNLGIDQQQAVDHGAIEVDGVLSSESEPTDNDETNDINQSDAPIVAEKINDTMPLEAVEGEGMKPEEESAIVDAPPEGNDESIVESAPVENPANGDAPDDALDDRQPVSGQD